jgi:phage shock protein C
VNISDEIKRLHELHQAGALTDAEFEQAKAKLLAASVNLNKSSSGSSGYGGSSGSSDIAGDLSRLRRSRSDRWLGGVCGGLAKVTGMESWIWRLVFTLCFLFAGFGILIYLLMWIFVPEE